jgi:hypothetical protein
MQNLRTFVTRAHKHESRTVGYPEAAMAGPLGVELGWRLVPAVRNAAEDALDHGGQLAHAGPRPRPRRQEFIHGNIARVDKVNATATGDSEQFSQR